MFRTRKTVASVVANLQHLIEDLHEVTEVNARRTQQIDTELERLEGERLELDVESRRAMRIIDNVKKLITT